MRSRLVAQQYNWAKRDDVTQNTPPLVAARLLVSKAASFGHKVGPEARCLAVWDCSVAFYHAPLGEDIVVVPPKGLCPEGFVWQLRRAMNGTRKASLAFGSVVTEELVAMPAAPFAEVVVSPMCFYSKGLDVALLVHGDDFFAEGRAEALLQVDEYLRSKFRINLVSLAGPRQEKEIKFLKRVITYGPDGWTWTGDPAHRKQLVDELNFGGAKGAATPGSKATAANDPHREDTLTPQRAEKYRSLAGRLLYHSLDGPRVQFDTGLVMRGMSTPRVLDEARLHRAVRYLAGAPGVDWLFRWQGVGEALKLYGLADADHAADDESRRSVSCSQEFLGGHLLDQEVGRQTCVAISSGESEFHALTLCAARLIFAKSLADGFGFPPRGRPDSLLGLLGGEGHCEPSRRRKAQTSSGQKPLVAEGSGGRAGGGRQDRHAAEHGRLGHQVLGRSAAEAADWDAAPARNTAHGHGARHTREEA